VIAHRVEGINQGAYLYRRGSRSLHPLIGSTTDVDGLLVGAAESCGAGLIKPQVLLVLAARFPDLAVKYEGLAYALMVKHVGVLMAAIAYSASAMGLGAVPLGTGDSDAFAKATGLDYYRHGSIGEIALCVIPTNV
jgi:SagB-type dehydrogenase family enzyme